MSRYKINKTTLILTKKRIKIKIKPKLVSKQRFYKNALLKTVNFKKLRKIIIYVMENKNKNF